MVCFFLLKCSYVLADIIQSNMFSFLLGPLLRDAFSRFRKFCVQSNSLPADLHYIISDIIEGAGHHLDIFPYFLRHTKEVFPHLECLDDLKKVSDLRNPASW